MRSRAQLLIAFFSAMAVTLVAVTETGRTSPGTLATVHQREPDLSGKNDCSSCHGGLFGTLREACLECHEPIALQLEESAGLHGTLGARAEQCGLCHSEHHGGGAPLVHGQSFALAGVNKVEEFDHRLVGFPMDGVHLEQECTKCHENAHALVLGKGETRYLGLEQDCATCHEDAHAGQFAAACASCHGQTTWDGLASQGHERFLPLVGGHGGLACTTCHAEGEGHELDVVGGRGARPAARTCVDCHESPHRPGFVAGVAALAAMDVDTACVTCHASEHTSFHDQALLGMTREQHAASGFPLDVPHDRVECTACHAVERVRFAGRYPGRTADQCSACHEDVHQGQFEQGPFAGGGCLACHERTHFDPPAFDAKEHARSALELTGRHVEIGCEECHRKAGADAARTFTGTPDQCDACHEDAHQGFFDAVTRTETRPRHGECERCHDTTRFAAAEKGFDHERFTGFAVQGAHAESQCAACHPPLAEPDGTGRSFGRVAASAFPVADEGAFAGCVPCHADPHHGRFDPDTGVPETVGGRAGCARCHADSSFRYLPHGFDHGTWTGFALRDAHAEASCSACHAPLSGPDARGRTAGAAPGPRCADCHEDPHAGQFAGKDGVTDCQRCHDDGRQHFLSFDHEHDARFALGEAHRSLACGACHKPTTEGAVELVRYRPLGRECVDCHGTNAEVLLRRQPRKR